MKDCLFCKIVRGEIPCFKIYEDDHVLAFLDIAKDAYGHTLIVPKKHFDTMKTCDNATLDRVIEACKKIGNAYCEKGFDGWNLINNTGKAAGPHVMHMHIHLIPRKEGDGAVVFPQLQGGDCDLEKVCQFLKLPYEKPKLEVDDQNAVVIHTDGACSGNPGAGGWACILSFQGKEKVLSGGEKNTTNNRMELMAVICALESVKKNVPVKVFSDSAYVVNAFKQGWLDAWQKNNWKNSAKEPVLNQDLWQRLLLLVEKLDVEFFKVKGHSDNEMNNRCDELARAEILKMNG